MNTRTARYVEQMATVKNPTPVRPAAYSLPASGGARRGNREVRFATISTLASAGAASSDK